MNQADRDRLVALKKAKDGKMTQRQAAEELKISERQVRRLLVRLRKVGDKAVLHGCEAAPTGGSTKSNRRRRSRSSREMCTRVSGRRWPPSI